MGDKTPHYDWKAHQEAAELAVEWIKRTIRTQVASSYLDKQSARKSQAHTLRMERWISNVVDILLETAHRQPPENDLVGLCWSVSSKPRPVDFVSGSPYESNDGVDQQVVSLHGQVH